MSKKLEGKIAVVTGGTTGIGFATARRFASEGAQVIITGRREAELNAAVAKIGNAIGLRADSADLADLDTLFAQIKARKGHIDVLFVNAGGGSMQPLGAITEEQYEDTFGRNVKGALFTVQKALPLLADGASVIMTGSTTGSTGNAGLSVYGASKAALRSFARSWILDLKGRNIRVNTLSPGATKTEGLLAAAGPDPAQQQGFLGFLASQVPMGRVADPRRDRESGGFPGQRRLELCHRQRDVRRRRAGSDLISAARTERRFKGALFARYRSVTLIGPRSIDAYLPVSQITINQARDHSLNLVDIAIRWRCRLVEEIG